MNTRRRNSFLLSLMVGVAIALSGCSEKVRTRGIPGGGGPGGGGGGNQAAQPAQPPKDVGNVLQEATEPASSISAEVPVVASESSEELGPIREFAMIESGKAGVNKVYFNQVQRKVKLDPRFLAKVTPEMLNEWGNSERGQGKLDQFYSLLPSGYIPEGPFKGTVIFAKDDTGKITVERMVQALHLPVTADRLKQFAQSLWKGKKFEVDEGRPILRNMMELTDKDGNPNRKNLQLFQWLFKVDPLKEGSNVIIKDVYDDGRKLALVMPARVFCGVSLLDARRESIIIDYEFSDDDFGDGIGQYLPSVDDLAGRKGLKIRDEIRMVRPGLYLGRAYITNVFFLNFVLETQEPKLSSVAKKQNCYDSARPGLAQRYFAD